MSLMNPKLEAIEALKTLIPKYGKIQIKNFKKGEIVTSYLAKRNQICIVLEGTVDLIRYEISGSKTIVERLRTNDLFGEAFYSVITNNELFAIAKEDSKVLQFVYQENNHSGAFYKNLLTLALQKSIDQNIRIELLTKTTIREKLLFYFSYLSVNNFGKEFQIPFSYTDLADYFHVDRSALMRELQHMEKEGFIERKGRKIKLLY